MFSAVEVCIVMYLLHWVDQRDFKDTATLRYAYLVLISCCSTFASCRKKLLGCAGILAENGRWPNLEPRHRSGCTEAHGHTK